MKKILYCIIFSVILFLSFGVNSFAAYSSDHSYFDWDDGRGIIMVNGDSPNDLFLHYHNGRFYCDENCTVECIALGYDNKPYAGSIAWWPVVDISNPGISGGDVERQGRTSFHSPGNLSQLLFMVNFAANALYVQYNYPIFAANLHIHICMHDNYILEHTEYSCTYAESQDVWVLDWNNIFSGNCTITRKDGLTDTLININSQHMDENINFNPGRVIFDNNTTNDTDVAILVNHGTLLMAAWAQIVNSKSTPDNNATYHGTGVRVIDNGLSSHLPSVELGYDASANHGTFKIKHNRVGIDLRSGVLRFKMSVSGQNGVSLGDNVVAVNMVYGTSLGKWADDISSFFSTDWLITLEEPAKWHSGDVLFTSGQSRAGSLHNTPLNQADVSAIHFAPGSDLTKKYNIEYDSSIANSANYLYPMFILAKPSIYNTRTKHWDATLYDAVNNSEFPIADNDVLVYYGNVREQHNVEIKNDLTIRSAKAGTSDADLDDLEEPINPDGYNSMWVNADGVTSFIKVEGGKTVSLGGSDSGPLTVNLNSKGRGFDVYGTLNIKTNYTLTQGNRPSGAGVNIQSTGVVTLDGGTLTNHTATTSGGAFYVTSGGVLNIKGGTIIGCTSPNGAGVFQGGTMNLQGTVNFGATLPVYLPVDKVITKTGAISATGTISTTPADEYDGRDLLVSKSGSTDSASGRVINTDLNLIVPVLSNSYTYGTIFNATGNNNPSMNPKDVIELTQQLGELTIVKNGLATGENAIFTVTPYGTSMPSYTITVSDSANTAIIKDLPIMQYTVTEVTAWSWAYTVDQTSKTQNIGVSPTFIFTNSAKPDTANHAEASKVNNF